MKSGSPPTERKARTGEFTPPGMSFCARSNRARDLGWFMSFESAAAPAARRDLPERDAELAPQAGFQAEIGLAAGDQILHEVLEGRAAPAELYHAGRDRVEQK